ncbi:sensor histidine kinase [Vibrio paucivorans]|uniref:histidine kinase n=1 Tax=Vibrio paucivorans TaxID=2829489 RepID=A0A9X3CGQ7_9VIBR|nr:HAMP domain-containing sensor histidine kinase [Vibrio paucivorans]MCW8335582.1 HAMP domain-containing histidine kinase [Vibrio paucivorans]
MSSNLAIDAALKKTQRALLCRFMAVLLVCLLVIEAVVGGFFFYDLYQTEKKLMNSMATEYQRILTYDSAQRLEHVLVANPLRLTENNVAAFSVDKAGSGDVIFVSGDDNIPAQNDLATYVANNKSWFQAFIISPYMAIKLTGEQQDFWLVLDNQARYNIALKQWLLTLYALLMLVVVTGICTYIIIGRTISPLITLGSLLERLRAGELDLDTPSAAPLSTQGLGLIRDSVHQAIGRLQHVTTTLNTTVDAIAHDIRTPLSRITLASQQALMYEPSPNKPKVLESALADCSEHAAQASNMLTALMKLNDELIGKRAAQSIDTDVRDIMNTVVSWYEDVADEKGVSLAVGNTTDRLIQSDPDKLTQVLVNLVDNAIKYTEAGGRVVLESVIGGNNQLEIRVIDNGIGIAPEYQDLVFERLYRVDTSRSNVSGYGLGLSLAAAMVSSLGGTISVESQRNQGSVFMLTLPR